MARNRNCDCGTSKAFALPRIELQADHAKREAGGDNRWDDKAGLRRDAIGSQVIDALEAQEIKETGNEED
jgi:hypothetical protein